MLTPYQTISRPVLAARFLGQPDPDGNFAGFPTRTDPHLHQLAVLVPTDGGAPAFIGDWVVRDARGALSVLGDEDFTAQYEPVPDPVVPEAPAPVVEAVPEAPPAE
jgi:hypothetical protein